MDEAKQTEEMTDARKRAAELRSQGKTPKEISEELKVNKSTLYYWSKKDLAEKKAVRVKEPAKTSTLVEIPISLEEDRVSVVLVNGSAMHVESVMKSIASILGR
jgi:orotate phosphoribosyltransferase-like protein